MPRYGPPDAFETPRFSGPRTFMRLPHVRISTGWTSPSSACPPTAPWSSAAARVRAGGIRSASVMLRNYNPILDVDVVDKLSLVDYGDVPTGPRVHGGLPFALRRGARGGRAARVSTLCLGGDHTILLAELRALAAVHGPLALVQLDAHHDLWDEYFGQRLFHGSVVRRAVEEGLIDPGRSVQAGLRGSSRRRDADLPREHGIDGIPYEELAALGPGGFSAACATASATPRASCPSTSTSSTRPSRRDRDAGGRRAFEPGGPRPTFGRSRAWTSAVSTASRSRRRSIRPP